MAHEHNDQENVLENPTNGSNPLTAMQDDEELDQDYDPPMNEGEDDEEEPEARLEMAQKLKEANDEKNQKRYNDALANALEISPTV